MNHILFWLIVLNSYSTENTIFYSDLKGDQLTSTDLPSRGYGTYYLKIRYLENCQPDVLINKENEYDYSFSIKQNGYQMLVDGYIYVPHDYFVVKAIFIPSISKDGKITAIYNKTSHSPCSDILLFLPLKQLLNMDSNCLLKKGNYTISNFVPDVWIHRVFKRKIIYERVIVNLEYFSKVERTLCLYVIVDMIPLPKVTKKKID